MSETFLSWLQPGILVVFGLVVGVLVDHIVVGRFRRYAERAENSFYSKLAEILGRSVILWCTAGGIYLASLNLPADIPPKARGTLDNALFILLAVSLTVIVARAAVAAVGIYTEHMQGVLPSTSIFGNFIKLLVFLLGGLVILQSLGISITPILTALGVGGLAVALALQETLTNLFSGLQILASRQIRPGDYVKLASGEEGVVLDITWRITTIQTLTLYTHVVPNSKLATVVVTNYNVPGSEMTILVPVGVSYSSDLDQVERITNEVARAVMQEVDGGVPDYEPVVRYSAFGDSSVDFHAVLRVSEFSKQFAVKSEFVKRLYRRYQREGIEIPFPIRTVQLVNGNGAVRSAAGTSRTKDAASADLFVQRG